MSLRSDLLDLAEHLRAEAEAHASLAGRHRDHPRHAIDWPMVVQAAADKATALMASYSRAAVLSILARHEHSGAAATEETHGEDHDRPTRE